MAKILYVGTFGSDDPTRATFPFISASGAVDAGHEAQVVLLGEATYLMKQEIVDQIHGVGFPPLKELFQKIADHGVPIHV
ncbi:MAG: DsrE family protein [Chloroflexota bacterium]|nr:DsrE family protein [Chloroflexota bacterium]